MTLFCFGLLASCATTKPIAPSPVKESYARHNYARTFQTLLPAAKSGNAESQYALGYMYYYGLGIAKDQDIARVWIEKSAKQNYAPAIEAYKEITRARDHQYTPLQTKA